MRGYQNDQYTQKFIGQLGKFGEPLMPLSRQISDTIENVGSLEQLYPLRELLKEFTAAMNSQLKELISYGDSLDKASAKELADSMGFATWQQYKKQVSALAEQIAGTINDEQLAIDCNIKYIRQTIKEAKWLTDKFGEGEYKDVLGLCKRATIAEIVEKNWSLTPGAYVGVPPVEDEDEENFAERMAEIHRQLLSLQAEANELMDTISANFEGLGL